MKILEFLTSIFLVFASVNHTAIGQVDCSQDPTMVGGVLYDHRAFGFEDVAYGLKCTPIGKLSNLGAAAYFLKFKVNGYECGGSVDIEYFAYLSNITRTGKILRISDTSGEKLKNLTIYDGGLRDPNIFLEDKYTGKLNYSYINFRKNQINTTFTLGHYETFGYQYILDVYKSSKTKKDTSYTYHDRYTCAYHDFPAGSGLTPR